MSTKAGFMSGASQLSMIFAQVAGRDAEFNRFAALENSVDGAFAKGMDEVADTVRVVPTNGFARQM